MREMEILLKYLNIAICFRGDDNKNIADTNYVTRYLNNNPDYLKVALEKILLKLGISLEK